MEWWNCDRDGHAIAEGTLADLYLELITDAVEDPASSLVLNAWCSLGNLDARWCPRCGYFELATPAGPSTRLRRRTR